MKLKSPLLLIGFIILSQLAGAFGAIFTAEAIPTWYATLNKPFFNPPSFVFAPVWITLYTLMGIAAYLVWERSMAKKLRKEALTFFGAQLLLNAIWTPIFFGAKQLLLAFGIIVLLLIMILITTKKFWHINKLAGKLMIPYILWVTFAALLNLSIYLLN